MHDTATMRAVRPQPFYLQTERGRLFCLTFSHNDRRKPETAAVIVAPFAEEMNRCRRQSFLIAQSLAEAGVNVIIPDFYGTGDSDGDFADARLDHWFQDVCDSVDWLRQNGCDKTVLVGTRFGGLVASSLISRSLVKVERLILIQPVLNGQQYINQFLRLRLAADAVTSSESKLTTKDLRHQLKTQLLLEVAGYELADELVSAIDALSLSDCLQKTGIPIDWIEVSYSDGALSPAASRIIDQLDGRWTRSHLVPGEPFWATQETTTVPDLAQYVKRIVLNTG